MIPQIVLTKLDELDEFLSIHAHQSNNDDWASFTNWVEQIRLIKEILILAEQRMDKPMDASIAASKRWLAADESIGGALNITPAAATDFEA